MGRKQKAAELGTKGRLWAFVIAALNPRRWDERVVQEPFMAPALTGKRGNRFKLRNKRRWCRSTKIAFRISLSPS